jgi:hypothetical protein
MPKLFISEYTKLGAGFGAESVIVKEPALVEQTPVVIGATSLQSAAFNSLTRIVRIHTDVVCSIAFGVNPTANADSKRLAANQTEYFAVQAGEKVAVITNT